MSHPLRDHSPTPTIAIYARWHSLLVEALHHLQGLGHSLVSVTVTDFCRDLALARVGIVLLEDLIDLEIEVARMLGLHRPSIPILAISKCCSSNLPHAEALAPAVSQIVWHDQMHELLDVVETHLVVPPLQRVLERVRPGLSKGPKRFLELHWAPPAPGLAVPATVKRSLQEIAISGSSLQRQWAQQLPTLDRISAIRAGRSQRFILLSRYHRAKVTVLDIVRDLRVGRRTVEIALKDIVGMSARQCIDDPDAGIERLIEWTNRALAKSRRSAI